MSNETTFTDANFQNEVLEAKMPVLVDFWASWCHPCRMLAPIIEEIANEYQGKAKIGKLNAEENPNMAGQYGVISIPTLIIFKDGQPVDQIIGAVPKEMITKKLDHILSKE